MKGNYCYEAAITGRAFDKIVQLCKQNERIYDFEAKEVLKKVLKQAKVYSRMSPKQKGMLIEELQHETGEQVGM